MAADEGDEVRQAARRIETLIAVLEKHPDREASVAARELVTLVLDLHALGLARLMTVLAQADSGGAITERLMQEDAVRGMLLLHGLHPEEMEVRVRRAVERLRPHLGVHGLRLEVAEVADGAVRLRVDAVDVAIKPPLLWTLPAEIENAVIEAAPDVERVIIEGLDFGGAARHGARSGTQSAQEEPRSQNS